MLVATDDRELERSLAQAGLRVVPIQFTPFDTAAASKVRHFETYNRTAASQRVADIVAAVRAHPNAPLVAAGDPALAALLASAVVSSPLTILDVGQFDTGRDAPFVERLYVPGLRRAGDLQTAAAVARGKLVLHNAGETFTVTAADLRRNRLTPHEIVSLIRATR